ncbi:hypothetical protein PPACK8108_LOCUS5434 [Phakopsora pachyrhizi]|uniref:Uncharacterized protein n=1 Tax=Phakopsora pachyrhizi TaxID=170000 RepID=A0AAV0AP21_PHAPC|nr:hypothetical protein PPACK8108_LOCUS5434 [Phakopsora pachyrhizi]
MYTQKELPEEEDTDRIRTMIETESEEIQLGLNRSLIDANEFERIKGKIESDNQKKETESLNGSGIGRRDNWMAVVESHQVINKALMMMTRTGLRFNQKLENIRAIQQNKKISEDGPKQTTSSIQIKLNVKNLKPYWVDRYNEEPGHLEDGGDGGEKQRIQDKEDTGLQDKGAEDNGLRIKE